MTNNKSSIPNHFSERKMREASALRENLKRRRQSKAPVTSKGTKDSAK